MSYHEDYIDSFERTCEHGRHFDMDCVECAIESEDEDDEWECCYPGECLMGYAEHMRSECYTVEDAEEMDGGV